VPGDLETAEAALALGDLQKLGEVAEANALAMHASAIAARPAIIYWQPTTLAVLAAVRELRGRGIGAWATMDAGPHVKVLTSADDAAAVDAAVRSVAGVTSTMISAAGNAATVLPDH
jgi:diphosphomevalonate decarboxylase